MRVGSINGEQVDIEESLLEDQSQEELESGTVSREDLNDFCSEVLERIKSENALSTPLSFQICFERLLEERDENFKEAVYGLLELELDEGYDKYIDIERYMRRSFRSMKKILEVVAVLYKNQELLYDILQKKTDELKKVDGNVVISRNILQLLVSEVHRLIEITKKQSATLKDLYQESASIINNVDGNTMFDSQFGIYNSRFIAMQTQKEIDALEKTQRNSTLLVLELSKVAIQSVNDSKTLLMIQKSVADMLLKTSRRSDVVAHYKDGVFAILLRQSDLQSSQAVCKRLFELVKSSNTFINNTRIVLEVNIAITPLKNNQSVDTILETSLKTLAEMSDQKSAYKIIGE